MHVGVLGEFHLVGNGVYDLARFLLEFTNEFFERDFSVGVFFVSSLNDFFNRHASHVDVVERSVFVAGSSSKDAETFMSSWGLIVDDEVEKLGSNRVFELMSMPSNSCLTFRRSARSVIWIQWVFLEKDPISARAALV